MWCRGLLLAALAHPVLGSPAAARRHTADGEAQWRSYGNGNSCGLTEASARTEPAATLEQCKAMCAEAAACGAVEFHATGACRLLPQQPLRVRPALGVECVRRLGAEYADVFVMLPLDVVSASREITDRPGLERTFDKLEVSGIDGVMLDVWWGMTELSPKVYNFTVYKELFDMIRARGWKLEVVASFHSCGGNVGDSCDIPLPSFVHDHKGIWYTDALGAENREYISLFADDAPLVGGRTPVDMYRDWLEAFASTFSEDLGSLITEVMMGMGPAGELRYPSYPSDRWAYCGVGEFQVFDKRALTSLRAAAEAASMAEWVSPPGRAQLGHYGSLPHHTDFFTTGYATEAGKFFLGWYSGALKAHARRLLGVAAKVFDGKTKISGKVSGIHWWYDTPSHAAELAAGYYNTNSRDGYKEIAGVFAEFGATLDFTCLEMRNTEQPLECLSNPEALVKQVAVAATSSGIEFSGENALQRYDVYAYAQVETYLEYLSSFTFLRLNPALLTDDHLATLSDFVAGAHGAVQESDWDAQQGNESYNETYTTTWQPLLLL